jgi:hypothetical protein
VRIVFKKRKSNYSIELARILSQKNWEQSPFSKYIDCGVYSMNKNGLIPPITRGKYASMD